MLTKAFGFKPTPKENTYLTRRLAETHKTPSAFLHQVLKIYQELEQEGFIDLNGDRTAKTAELEKLKTTEQIKTEEIVKRETAKQATEKLRLETLKKKNTNSVFSKQPKVDWGASEGGFEVGGGYDGFHEE